MAKNYRLEATMNKHWLAILIFFSSIYAYSQRESTALIATDGINLYVAERGEIIKFDNNGSELVRYSSQFVDEYTNLDCSQPLKVLAFSEFSQQYIILDQFMAEAGTRRLIDLGIRYASVLCSAKDGNIWVVDQTSMILYKIDPLRDIQLIQVPLENLISSGENSIRQMVEHQGRIYLLDENKGVLMFDLYGNYLGLPVEYPVKSFQVIDDTIYYSTGKEIRKMILGKKESTLVLGDSKKEFAIIKDKLIGIEGGDLYFKNIN